MEPTTFGFSKFIAWTGMIFFTGITVFFLYLNFIYLPVKTVKTGEWLFLGFIFFVLLGLLFSFLRWCFIPMVQGRIILEIDEEKVQNYLTGTVISWKDVAEISTHYIGEPYILFRMANGQEDINISTRWIAGSTESISDKMQEYFAATL